MMFSHWYGQWLMSFSWLTGRKIYVLFHDLKFLNWVHPCFSSPIILFYSSSIYIRIDQIFFSITSFDIFSHWYKTGIALIFLNKTYKNWKKIAKQRAFISLVNVKTCFALHMVLLRNIKTLGFWLPGVIVDVKNSPFQTVSNANQVPSKGLQKGYFAV